MIRRRALRSFGLFALLLGSCGAEVAPAVRGDVGVAPFAVNAGEGETLPDVANPLAQKLGGLGVGAVVPPTAIGATAASPRSAERAALRERTGARTLVIGSATRIGEQLSLDARVLDLDSGLELGTPLVERASGEADLPRAIDALAARVAGRILEPPPASPAPDADKKKKKPRRVGEPRDPIEIQADTLDAQTVTGGRRLSFSGHVNAVQGEISLHCEQLEAFYPSGASEPDKLVAKGNIRVVQRDRTASCDEAVFYRSEDKLVCTGKPAELTEKCNRAEAERITFYLESEKVEMVRGKVLGRDCSDATP